MGCCPQGQRQAAAIAPRAACSGVEIQEYTHAPLSVRPRGRPGSLLGGGRHRPHHAGSVKLLGQRPQPPRERGSRARQRSRCGRREGLPRPGRGWSWGIREAGKILSFLFFSCYYGVLFLFLLSGGYGEKEVGEPC